MFFVTITQTDR